MFADVGPRLRRSSTRRQGRGVRRQRRRPRPATRSRPSPTSCTRAATARERALLDSQSVERGGENPEEVAWNYYYYAELVAARAPLFSERARSRRPPRKVAGKVSNDELVERIHLLSFYLARDAAACSEARQAIDHFLGAAPARGPGRSRARGAQATEVGRGLRVNDVRRRAALAAVLVIALLTAAASAQRPALDKARLELASDRSAHPTRRDRAHRRDRPGRGGLAHPEPHAQPRLSDPHRPHARAARRVGPDAEIAYPPHRMWTAQFEPDQPLAVYEGRVRFLATVMVPADWKEDAAAIVAQPPLSSLRRSSVSTAARRHRHRWSSHR